MLNHTVMMGRLCADPELRQTQSGVSVCSARIAVDRDYGKGEKKETDFFDVVAWRGTAEFICKYFSKGRMIVAEGRMIVAEGRMIVAEGRMQTRPWTDKDGKKRVAVELVAENVYFGDSKREDSADNSQGGCSNQAPAPSDGYNGPLPGSVPGDFAPDF